MKALNECVVTIVGLGMEGGSLAISLRENIKPKRIYAVDRNPETLAAAKLLKVIDEGFADPRQAFSESDLIIMAIYPAAIAPFIKKYQDSIKTNCIVTDVAGTKVKLIHDILPFLRDDLEFVFAHPMAGNEHRGFLFADKKIFNQANYIIVPTERNSPEALQFIEALALGLGCARVIYTDAKTHDKRIAYASQLVHLIATSITNCDSFDAELQNFVGGSFRDITRVAKINADLWSDAFLENKEALLLELEAFKKNLNQIEAAIKENNYDEIYRFLQKSYEKRSQSSF